MSFAITFSRSKVWKLNVNKLFKVMSNRYEVQNQAFITKQIRHASDRRYSDKHEWLALDSTQKIGTVGISKYAEEALGDVVYVQLPDVDQQFAQNETICVVVITKTDEVGAVESVKAASEIFTPVSGRIVEINDKLEDKPGLKYSTNCGIH
ncbi:unnamed protein product [Oppiella nova]|uniref:Glycine cleavage system H protein, mitochondrial n=1 Tax=Oppiella nova TaxID=334625 RepID=A0A7R9MPW7_9ACAR|nr:unnamed protein product [Oppiella nova]CAG2181371.1 unnamed protein product [Oppiella nova]